MDPAQPPARSLVEHVALAEEFLRALGVQDRAAVDLGGEAETDPGREIRLDGAGDHIHRGALGGHDQMDARGPRHLGEPLHAGLDLLAGDHHQIRHLVDDDHDAGQMPDPDLHLLVDRLAGLRIEAGLHLAGQGFGFLDGLGGAGVETADVAHPDLRHQPVALLHLPDHPFQGRDRGPGIGVQG